MPQCQWSNPEKYGWVGYMKPLKHKIWPQQIKHTKSYAYFMEYWDDIKCQAITFASDIETFPCKILQCKRKAKSHHSKLNTPHIYISYKCQAQNSWCQANIIIFQTTCPAMKLLNIIARIECWNNCWHETYKMRLFCAASPYDFKVCLILAVFYDVILCGAGCQ